MDFVALVLQLDLGNFSQRNEVVICALFFNWLTMLRYSTDPIKNMTIPL